MDFSVQDICEVFFNLEEKYNLNYQEIQGCYPWQLIRMFLYYDITRRTQTFGAPQQQSLSVFDKIKSFTPFVKNSILHNPFSGKQNKDILIFDHPRKVIYNGEYCDIYSNFLVDFLKDSYSFEVLEAPYLNEHFTKKQSYIKYTDRIQLGSYIYKKFNKIEFTQKEKELIFNVKKDLEDAFNLEINLEWIFTIHILNFTYDYKKYTELFKKRKPKIVFVVVAYENQAIVAAAKDLGITAVELQHGTITDYHLGYSYPKKTRLNGEIKYFPDKILTFGDYWINDETCPIDSKTLYLSVFRISNPNQRISLIFLLKVIRFYLSHKELLENISQKSLLSLQKNLKTMILFINYILANMQLGEKIILNWLKLLHLKILW